ncbi:MAG: PQQ-binding-like beta-propeller repeat protein [Planctomycetota bacterium]|nr:PQQ-binding-like beta-propeller repeat protein [Planctomycetota bacterium]
MRRLGLALLVTLLASSLAAQGVGGRFERWEELPEEGFHFDPDKRRVTGFSVRASTGARTKLDEIDQAWSDGDPERAAGLLRELAEHSGGEVIQIAGDRELERWVGAAEWALYQLRLRVSDSLLEGLLSAEERAAVDRAANWRDVEQLQALAWQFEGAREGLEATALLARLQAERGAWQSARNAAERALSMGAGESMEELLVRLPVDVASSMVRGPMPDDLERVWARTLSINALADVFHYSENPFSTPSHRYEAPFAPVQPVVSEGVIYISDSLSMSALDLISGRTLWHHAGPIERITLDGSGSQWFDFSVYAARNRLRAISPFQCARPVLSGDVVLGTVQSAEPVRELDEFEGYPINHPLPRRRLRALDRDTGELLWTQEQPERPDRDFVNLFDAAGPPAVGGGVAYVAGSVTEGAINAYLAAFDVKTGDLLWKTLLCSGQQDLTMFNRPFQEHVISPPLLHDGALYISTNLGVIGCVDAWSGRVRWLSRYESIERVGATGVRSNQDVRDIHWQNQEPFIEDGMLFVTPLDSRNLIALDPQTGRTAYDIGAYVRRRSPVRHQVIPRGDGRILVVTDTGVECFEARTGATVWPHKPFEAHDSIDYPVDVTGAATRSGDTLLVPCARHLVLVDVWTGEVSGVLEWQQYARSPHVQRVVHADSSFVMNDGRDVFAAADIDQLIQGTAGDKAVSLEQKLALAELGLVLRQYEKAQGQFESLLESVPQGPEAIRHEALLQRARSGRLEAAVRKARDNDAADDWSTVLSIAETTEQLFAWAPEALESLQKDGRRREVSDWLTELALRSPDRLLDFGSEGVQAARLLAARHRLPFAVAEERLALLQGLLLTAPGIQWGGVPVWEEARRRIDALLEEEGRELYAVYEARAKDDLERGLPLEVVEVRFPNSRAVAHQRLSDLDRLLKEGQARAAFEMVAQLGSSADMLAFRERAARALGEMEFADLLAGQRPLSTGMSPLPRLPRSGDGRVAHVMSPRNDVVLPRISGRPSPEFSSCALGVIGSAGEMFLLDAKSGLVRWRGRALPGGLLRGRSSPQVCFENELFIIRSGDSVEVGRLADGHAIWTKTTPRLLATASAGGLVLLLREDTESSLRVDALGLRTGAHAFSVHLPNAQSASDFRFVGPYLVVSTQAAGAFGRLGQVQLTVIDVEKGQVASVTSMASNLRIVNVLAEPPTVFLAAGMRVESKLVAWSPATASILWEAILPEASLTRLELFPTAPGKMLYCESVTVGNTIGRADIVYPIDALNGPLEPPVNIPLFTVLPGSAGAVSPLVVMRDPVSKQAVCVLDGATGEVLYMLDFNTRLDGFTQVHQGEDGFVLVSETSYDPTFVTSAWIVHGADGQERYSVQLNEPNQRDAADVLLVDEGVLIAIGGTVHVIRDRNSSR